MEEEGLTTQQWAVLGALSRPKVEKGMNIAELARYLMLSRQNLAGVVGRMERDGHLISAPDPTDRRSRLVTMSPKGREVWKALAEPKIRAYYDEALDGFAFKDMVHMLHYLQLMLDNMKKIDKPDPSDESENEVAVSMTREAV